MAANRPSGGTTTAITVTTWLAKLVRPRTVATGVGLIASSICVSLPRSANGYSRSCTRLAIVGAESRGWALPACCRAGTTNVSAAPATSTSRSARPAFANARAPRRPAAIEPGVNGYSVLDAIGLRELLRRVYRIEVEGGEHIPSAGPAVLAANHESLADPFFLGVATTRPIHYMAKAELWRNPVVGRLMTWLG